MIGPSCNFYTPVRTCFRGLLFNKVYIETYQVDCLIPKQDHPVDPEERLTDFEWATPIVIGESHTFSSQNHASDADD